MEDGAFCKDFEGYGIEYHKRSHSTNMGGFHAHSMLEMCFVYSGEGTLRVENTEYALRQNYVYLLHPNVQHMVITNPSILYDRTVLYVSFDYFEDYFRKYTRNILCSIFAPGDALIHAAELQQDEFDRVVALTDRIVQLSQEMPVSHSQPELIMTAHMIELLTVVGCAYLRETVEMPPMSGARQGLVLNDILAFINGNIGEKLTIECVAEHFHFSKPYVSHFFATKTGMPLSKYVVSRKVAAAKHLLSTTNLSIVDIGQKLSFCDTPHFYRVFKSVEGVTPRQFREQARRALFEQVECCNVYF